jgi:two-component system response regulator YesN
MDNEIYEQILRYYPQLQKVKAYVEAHYTEHISLETIAAVAGMEAAYFSAFFHRKVGLRFRDWLMRERIPKARAIFAAEDRSVTAVALDVGFRDVSTSREPSKGTMEADSDR